MPSRVQYHLVICVCVYLNHRFHSNMGNRMLSKPNQFEFVEFCSINGLPLENTGPLLIETHVYGQLNAQTGKYEFPSPSSTVRDSHLFIPVSAYSRQFERILNRHMKENPSISTNGFVEQKEVRQLFCRSFAELSDLQMKCSRSPSSSHIRVST